MKKIVLFLTVALVALSTARGAQIAQNQDQQTTIAVEIAVERQEIVAGPYARYAQKYLGVAAPLADKVLNQVTSVNMLDAKDMTQRDEVSASVSGSVSAYSHMEPAEGFPRLTVDRISANAFSLEESAKRAADKIFELRRSRLDLITGNLGENVFGGGLEAALAEISRLEEQYLSLFLGREIRATETKQYRVTPAKGRLTYTVCRFSETDGLVPQDDLSGVPVVLELKPVEEAQAPAVQTKPSSRAVAHLVPAEMVGRIILEGVELASAQITVWQLGETVWVNP
jgi:hypothetical protein